MSFESGQEIEPSADEVRQILLELNKKVAFGTMLDEVTYGRFLNLDSELLQREYLSDESSAKDVIDAFGEYLEARYQVEDGFLHDHEVAEVIRLGGIEKDVLFAYYGFTGEDKWRDARTKIFGIPNLPISQGKRFPEKYIVEKTLINLRIQRQGKKPD